MLKRLGLVMALAMMAVSMVPTAADAAGGSGGGGGGGGSVKSLELRVTGYITAIDYETGVITVGASYYGSGTLHVTSSTKISLDNINCSLDELFVGDWAEVRYDYYTKNVNKIAAISF